MSIPLIRSVLSNGFAQRIQFQLPGIAVRIAAGDFRSIAPILVAAEDHRPNTVAVDINPALGNLAMYRHQSNTLIIPRPNFPSSPTEEALLIHEAVHILNDRRGTPLPWDADEMLTCRSTMSLVLPPSDITAGFSQDDQKPLQNPMVRTTRH